MHLSINVCMCVWEHVYVYMNVRIYIHTDISINIQNIRVQGSADSVAPVPLVCSTAVAS